MWLSGFLGRIAPGQGALKHGRAWGRMMAKDLVAVERRALTPAQFGDLADVPSELEWLANITNPQNPPRL